MGSGETQRQRLHPWGSLALIAAVAIAPAESALAADEQELEAAGSRVASGNFEEAESRLRHMLDPKEKPCPRDPVLTERGCRLADAEMIQKARGYFATALVANGKKEEARAPIDDMLVQDPAFSPSSTLFPQPVIDLFIEERGHLAERLAKIVSDKAIADGKIKAAAEARKKEIDGYIGALEKQAATELVVENRSRWIAAIPFGVGQYQNDNVGLGLLFTISETVTTATTVATWVVAENWKNSAIYYQNQRTISVYPFGASTPPGDPPTYALLNSRLQAVQAINDVSFGVLAVFAVAGIIEAEVNFKGETKKERDRKLPPKPKLEVTGLNTIPLIPGSLPPVHEVTSGLGLSIPF